MITLEDILTANLPGISPGTALYLCENAVACLHRQNHSCGVMMACKGIDNNPETINWTTPFTGQMDRSLNDQEVATEHGAVCISVLYALQHTEFTVIQRSRKKTGVDYWLGRKEDILFQNAARMEVSGIFDDPDKVNARVKRKLEQSDQSDMSGLPAFISVVEFSLPSIDFVKK